MGAGLALAAWLAAAAPASAQDPAVSTQTAVAEVRVERTNVFDPRVPGEGIWPFRTANRIHILTLERIVRQELLLHPGEPWDELRALESERNLRAMSLFRRASVTTVPRPDGRLDLEVRTQDAWTLLPQASVGTEGGEHFFIFGLKEDNLLGRGKSVAYQHEENGPHRRNEYSYNDPRLLGTRLRLSPAYLKTEFGDSISVEVLRPFFSLETPYSAGMFWRRTLDEGVLYRDAEEDTKFLQRSRITSLGFGTKVGEGRDWVHRLEGGWYAESQKFGDLSDTDPGTRPVDRDFSGPTLGYTWVQPRYVRETNIDRMERVEDYNLGNELALYGGPMPEALGSDRDRWVWRAADRQGFPLGAGRFALAEVGSSGRLAGGHAENALLFANLNLFWKSHWPYPQTWVAHLEGNSGEALDGENQLILGGDNGLRGYRNNAFTGSRSVLLNLENRVFFPGEYFHLMRWGAAVFFDSGAVYPEGHALAWRDFHSDIGAGLRLSSTRSRSGGVLRVDVAYALNRGPGPDRWVVTVKGQQAFKIFNSSGKRLNESPKSRLTEVEPKPF